MFASVLKRSLRIKYLPWDEVGKLLASVDQSTRIGRRDHLLLRVMSESGPRRTEVIKLTSRSMYQSGGNFILQIPTAKEHRKRDDRSGRRSKDKMPPRPVPVGEGLVNEWNRYVTEALNVQALGPAGEVFPISEPDIYRIVRKYARISKLDRPDLKVHPHTLRHSFAIKMLQEGVPMPVLSEWLGHATIISTMVYSRFSQADNMVYFRRADMTHPSTDIIDVRPVP